MNPKGFISDQDLHDCERKAWESLSKYKFMMFGYWAAMWVHFNRHGGRQWRNPFKAIVDLAKEKVNQ